MEDFGEDFSLDELNTLLNMFRDQSLQILDEMTQDLFVLESKGADSDCLGRLRRGAHTIKGDSACVGLDGITAVAHRLEDFMEALVSGGMKFDARSVDAILEGLDEIRAALDQDPVGDIAAERAQRLIEKIEEAAMDAAEAAVSQALPSDAPAQEADAEPKPSGVVAPPRAGKKARQSVVEGIANPSKKSKTASAKSRRKTSSADAKVGGEKPAPRAARGRRKNSVEAERTIGETANSHDLIKNSLTEAAPALPLVQMPTPPSLLDAPIAQALQSEVVAKPTGEAKTAIAEPGKEETPALPESAAAATSTARKTGGEFVRVEAGKIDALLNLAGEMVIARSVLSQLEPELEAILERHDIVERFGRARAQMDKLIAELHKSVVKIRMVTIDNVFKRFNRPMRELAQESGKQVELEMSGGETELDRALVDLIYEPILHLLRNAVDHGLEATAERLRLGKPEVGKIQMRAYHEGNQVLVEISDDGRGIDKEVLKRKAVENGLITLEEATQMSDDEAMEIIFIPGFSTARAVTLVSGRGIGMDAVKNAIEQMRGSVSLRSEVGVGTVFTLRMPLTLAIIRALLFTTSGQMFALPLLSVREIVRVKLAEVTNLDGFENFRLREQFISVVRPGVVLGIERRKGGSGAPLRSSNEEVYLIIVTVGSKKYGVVAESLFGDQELVIKPLDIRWVHNDALAGASVLGDGRVVLIMDAEMMFRKAVRHERTRGIEKRQYAV
ncbi:MAG: chemotaxis protein CheA [Acidobacteria bacterium]|nr:chemotaxis protein CheA [Acidobacteriota bacterium]